MVHTIHRNELLREAIEKIKDGKCRIFYGETCPLNQILRKNVYLEDFGSKRSWKHNGLIFRIKKNVKRHEM